MKQIKPLFVNLSVSVVAIAFSLLAAEVFLRVFYPVEQVSNWQASQAVPLHLVNDKPYLYGLNTDHPDVSAQGLRSPLFVTPKPDDVYRILVIGDSVTFGRKVERLDAFPNKLEKLLQSDNPNIEVINAGVNGYTAYNELEFYREAKDWIDADLVIVTMCLNDAVNPRAHWGQTGEKLQNIPAAAIPNDAYDKNHILPLLEARESRSARAQSNSRVWQLITSLLWTNVADLHWPDPDVWPPTYITGDDTISIETLMDATSAEYRWLTDIYNQFRELTFESGSELAFVFAPLAYQLEDNYPYFPQETLAEYCAAADVPCIDLMDEFRGYKPDDVFQMDIRKSPNSLERQIDIWHLTELGHELAAKQLASFLQQNRLIHDT